MLSIQLGCFLPWGQDLSTCNKRLYHKTLKSACWLRSFSSNVQDLLTNFLQVQERSRIEANALAEEAKHCPQHVPALYHYDSQLALIVMQYLAPPHEILRKSLGSGKIFPRLASHVGTFLAQTLFKTSLLALDTRQYRRAIQPMLLSNSNVCPCYILCYILSSRAAHCLTCYARPESLYSRQSRPSGKEP